jgi:hypothetical protein
MEKVLSHCALMASDNYKSAYHLLNDLQNCFENKFVIINYFPIVNIPVSPGSTVVEYLAQLPKVKDSNPTTVTLGEEMVKNKVLLGTQKDKIITR